MTIVLGYAPYETNLLVADTLTSTIPDYAKDSFSTPIFGDCSNFKKGQDFVPSGLKQKLHIINPALAVGWAGSYIYARSIISDLYYAFENEKELSLEQVEEFFDGLDAKERNSSHFVGMVLDGDLACHWSFNAKGFRHAVFGEIRVTGSGIDLVHELFKSWEAEDFKLPADANKSSLAVAHGLATISTLFGLEALTGKNLLRCFGGAYEMISRSHEGFVKVGNLLSVLILVRVNDSRGETLEISYPRLVLKQEYRNGDLMLRRLLLKTESDHRLVIENEAVHVISPIGRAAHESTLNAAMEMSFDWDFLCLHVNVIYSDQKTEALNFIRRSQRRASYFAISQANNGYQVAISNEMFQDISESITDRVRSGFEVVAKYSDSDN